MDFITFPDLSLLLLTGAVLVTLFAAFTKGLTGFALPMIMVSGMTMFMDPKLAIASIVIPAFTGNVWQALRQGYGAAIQSLRKFWLLIGVTLVMIYLNAQWIGALRFEVLLMLLGGSIALISLVQIFGMKFSISSKFQPHGAVITGLISGFFGAIAGTWGPPIIIYLMAIETPKAEQVRVAGISFGLGALVFWAAHQRSGLVTPEALGLSVFLLIPMIIGLYLGAKAQDKIDQALFRKATLWVLLLAGLNIFRKALMG